MSLRKWTGTKQLLLESSERVGVRAGKRWGRGGGVEEGGAVQQNADDSGKSTQEKTFYM